jgi:hypothetical protein
MQVPSRQVPVTKLSTKTSTKLAVGVTKSLFELKRTSSLSNIYNISFSVDAKAPCRVMVKQFVVEEKNPSYDTIGYREDFSRYPEPFGIELHTGMAQRFPENEVLIDTERWSHTLLEFNTK